MKKIILLSVLCTVMNLFLRAEAQEIPAEKLAETLSSAFGAKVEVKISNDSCLIKYPETKIEETILDGETSKNVTTALPASVSKCAKVQDFKSKPQYNILSTSPHKILAQIYNHLGFAFIKDINIGSFREELNVVPDLELVKSRDLYIGNATYTSKDATTGLKKEIGNLQSYKLQHQLQENNGSIKYEVNTDLDALNLALPFFSMQMQKLKQNLKIGYQISDNDLFDYTHPLQNLQFLQSSESAVVGRGIKIAMDMFGVEIKADSDIRNITRRTSAEYIQTLGTLKLGNIVIGGDLINKEKQPKFVELKYSLKDIALEDLNQLNEIQFQKSAQMAEADSLENVQKAKNHSDEQIAKLLDKIADKAKLTTGIEITFEKAKISGEFVLQRKNGYLFGVGTVKVDNLYNIFPAQKPCAGKPKAEKNALCSADFMYAMLQDIIDVSKDSSSTIYKFTEQGIFKNNQKIGDPVELSFEKMYRDKQQSDKEKLEKFQQLTEEQSATKDGDLPQ